MVFCCEKRERKTKKLLVGFLVLCCALNVARAENNCTGATYYDADSDTCIACPAGYDYNTAPGKTDITQCQVHCDAGTWVSGEYTQLEYIESSGTQWIDTGIARYLNHNYRLQTGVEWTDTTQRQLVGVQGFYYVGCVNGYFQVTQGGSGHTAFPASPNTRYDMDIKFDYTNKTAYGTINNVSYNFATNVGYAASPADAHFGVFSLNDAVLIFGRAKQYYYRLYDNDVLVRDMVPARRNSDGVLGMYDKVSGQFFTNAGTGTFIAGNNVGQCVDVGAGYYAPEATFNYGSVGTRTECPAGTYSSITNAEVCTPCAGATYNDETAQTACKSCPAGYDYNTDPGKTSETECQIHCNAGTWNGEYTQLEYIESSGTQWINTGIIENTSLTSIKHYVGFSYSQLPTNRQLSGFDGYRKTNYWGVSVSGSDVVFEVYAQGTYSVQPNTIYDLYMEQNKSNRLTFLEVNLDNVRVDRIQQANDASIGSSRLAMFAVSGGSYKMTHARISYYKVYFDDVLVGDFVPVRRDSDGAIGMYDKVTNTFLGNAGTGTFIAGADIAGLKCTDVGAGYYAPEATFNYGSVGTRTACPAGTYSSITNAEVCTPCSGATYNDETAQAACKSCPTGYDYNTTPGKTDITQCQVHCNAGTYVETPGIAGYTQLEYIQSTGTQYIDTGVILGYNFTVSASAKTPKVENVIQLFGNVVDRTKGFSCNVGNSSELISRFSNVKYTGNLYKNSTDVHTYTMDKNGIKIDNDAIITYDGAPSDFTQTDSFYLLAARETTGAKNIMPSGTQLYSVKVYNNTLVRNFIPARRNSDGVVGMYDTVSGRFFANAGTGAFIAGDDVGAIGGKCVDVGAGYYSGASTVNFGLVGTRNACVAPTTTVGYGHGADEANDCGRILHIGDSFIYARRNKITTPSLNIRMENGDMFYISLSPTNHSVSRLHMQQGETKYTAYDDSLMYGERDFDTGAQIPQ